MSNKLPRYLKRIKTFYNPISDIISEQESEETDESDTSEEQLEMAASAAEVEVLLKKYSPTKSPKLHVLEPCTFGGTVNENARQWIQKFCNYATLNKIEEKEKILVFETLLTNSAQCWYENLADQYKNKWDDLHKLFKETYFNSNSWFNSQRVENRKLRPGESCTTYINNLIELSQLSGLTDVELSKAIIRGLPDKLKFQVISHNPKTLDETVQRILLSESMMPANNEDSMLCSLEDRVKPMEYYTPTTMPMQQFNRGRQQYQQEDGYPKNGDGAQA